MLKRLLRRPETLRLGAWLLGRYLALVYATTRWRLIGEEHMAPLAVSGSSVVHCFWHERLPLMPMMWRFAKQRVPELAGRRAHVLVSQHQDGRLIGDVIAQFDLAVVHGSSSRGGAAGMLAMLRLLRAGDVVAITPDGPRGPRRVAAPGTAALAAAAGMPVVPGAAATTRHVRLKSWDRMMLPLPFGRGVVVVGAPVHVARDDVEAGQAAVEAALSACCDAADAALGIAPV